MDHAIVFDCEFLTAEGAPSRFWCGPHDPDPVAVQVGLVRLSLRDGHDLLDTHRLLVAPRDRDGNRCIPDPWFTTLTGIAPDDIDRDGIPLREALAQVERIAAGAQLWSWGKDEFNLLAIGCYVEGFAPPIPAARFGNASRLMLKAGMPFDAIRTTPSSRLADWLGLAHPPLRAHDALDDALSVALAVQHLLRRGALDPADLR